MTEALIDDTIDKICCKKYRNRSEEKIEGKGKMQSINSFTHSNLGSIASMFAIYMGNNYAEHLISRKYNKII